MDVPGALWLSEYWRMQYPAPSGALRSSVPPDSLSEELFMCRVIALHIFFLVFSVLIWLI